MEKDWTNILSMGKLYRIEIAKNLLAEYDIESIIVNKKDSLYKFGDIELYVKNDDVEKALKIIKKFKS